MLFYVFSDKMFPALGFGAKLPGGIVSHEFPLVRNNIYKYPLSYANDLCLLEISTFPQAC